MYDSEKEFRKFYKLFFTLLWDINDFHNWAGTWDIKTRNEVRARIKNMLGFIHKSIERIL